MDTGGEQVRLELLQGFRLSRNGRQVDLPLGAQRLVAFLALQNGSVLRVYVAGNLWLDKPERVACGSLRSALWQLRRSGLDIVIGARGQLRLAPALTVDVHDTVAEAQRVMHGAATDEQIHRLLTGELLPDWYEDWVIVERERIRQLRLHALERLGQRLVDEGRSVQAIEAGLAAVAADPLRESAHRLVIRAHLAEGNHSEALRQFETYTRLLDDGLGLRPSEQMVALMRSMDVRLPLRFAG